MRQTILDLCRQFNITGELKDFKTISGGLINTTFQVKFEENSKNKKYILQKINKFVFKKPEEVMENICNVTNYIENQFRQQGKEAKRRVLKYLKSINGQPFIIDDYGEYWRVYEYVDNSVCYDNTSDLKVLEESGKAFGEFQALLNDFTAESLNITIENFHNVPMRFETFREIIEQDQVGRVASSLDIIEELFNLEQMASSLDNMLDRGELPLRVTHNDTKCNNVLFDKNTNDYLCVIDLDTVMPGLVASDYGDAIRGGASTSTDDEPDLNKVKLDLNKFKSFTKGFLSKVGANLTEKEIETLALGAVTIATELSLRFLTDYLSGDEYFKVDYPEHNLVRAKCQLALAKDMIKKQTKMQEVVNECINENEEKLG